MAGHRSSDSAEAEEGDVGHGNGGQEDASESSQGCTADATPVRHLALSLLVAASEAAAHRQSFLYATPPHD